MDRPVSTFKILKRNLLLICIKYVSKIPEFFFFLFNKNYYFKHLIFLE